MNGGRVRQATLAFISCALLLCGALAFPRSGASAQAVSWRLVQASDGSLYLLRDGIKQQIAVVPIGDDELRAIPDGDPPSLQDGQIPNPATPTPSPSPSSTPTVTPTPSPVPSATPIPPTKPGTILRFGDSWVGNGINMTVPRSPASSYDDFWPVKYVLDNRTQRVLNFETPASNFYLQLSTGQKWLGWSGRLTLNSWQPGDTYSGDVYIQASTQFFQALRDPQVTSFKFCVNNLNPNYLPGEACWGEQVLH